MIDFWCPNSGEPELSQGTIHLEAGRFYPIQCDYFQGDYEAKIQLFWSVDGSDYEVIPATAYYLPDGYTPSESRAEAVTISSDQKTTLISEGDTLSLQASVTPKEAPQKVIWSAASPAGGGSCCRGSISGCFLARSTGDESVYRVQNSPEWTLQGSGSK